VDVRGGLEAGVEVAELLRLALADVSGGEHLRRIRRHRLRLAREVRQRLVLDADQPRRVAGAILGVGRDAGDHVALIHRFGTRVLPGDHTLHARSGLGRGKVDRHDACMRVG
jgi:hypothetical protein